MTFVILVYIHVRRELEGTMEVHFPSRDLESVTGHRNDAWKDMPEDAIDFSNLKWLYCLTLVDVLLHSCCCTCSLRIAPSGSFTIPATTVSVFQAYCLFLWLRCQTVTTSNKQRIQCKSSTVAVC